MVALLCELTSGVETYDTPATALNCFLQPMGLFSFHATFWVENASKNIPQKTNCRCVTGLTMESARGVIQSVSVYPITLQFLAFIQSLLLPFRRLLHFLASCCSTQWWPQRTRSTGGISRCCFSGKQRGGNASRCNHALSGVSQMPNTPAIGSDRVGVALACRE
jgi:hypothetical protein